MHAHTHTHTNLRTNLISKFRSWYIFNPCLSLNIDMKQIADESPYLNNEFEIENMIFVN